MFSGLQSPAVMSRRVEPADSLDDFPTPPWATRAFFRYVMPRIEQMDCGGLVAMDPACGRGHMAGVLAEVFGQVMACDIYPYGFGDVADFLRNDDAVADWIITNPPFRLATEFILRGLMFARRGVAMLVRLQFLESDDRYVRLYENNPPHLIAQYVERVPMHRGRWVVNGNTASSYCWLVWMKHPEFDRIRSLHMYGRGFMWIPPSRVMLTYRDDVINYGGCVDIPKDHPAKRGDWI